MKFLKPKFWDQEYSFLSLILLPISLFYQLAVFLRKKFIKQKSFPIPIICIGNIYIGGTGKTPLAIKTFEILKNFNKNPVIIKKEYQNQKDELLLLKNYCKVISPKNRIEGIKNSVEKGFDTIILDDGFQDIEIKKNLNILCFNSFQKIGNGLTLPSGPLRENLRSLENCHYVFMNGEKDLEFENKLKRYNSKLKFFYYNYYSKNINEFKNRKLVAFAGIGNPVNFFNYLKSNRLNVVKEISYPDHYSYSDKELDNLKRIEKAHNAKLITTEKDFFRINPIFRKRVNYLPIKIKINEDLFKKEILNSIL